jgi:alanine-synthesizing transaminase
MSKTYSMAGCRIGFAVGNRHLIASLARIKSYVDYGAFTPIQVAAATALYGPQDCVTQIRALYKERRDVLLSGLKQAGWDVPVPEASMFAWAPIPESHRHLGSVAFAKDLLEPAFITKYFCKFLFSPRMEDKLALDKYFGNFPVPKNHSFLFY